MGVTHAMGSGADICPLKYEQRGALWDQFKEVCWAQLVARGEPLFYA